MRSPFQGRFWKKADQVSDDDVKRMEQPTTRAAVAETMETTSMRVRKLAALLSLVSLPMLCVYMLATLSFFGTYTGLTRVLQSGDNNAGLIGFIAVFLFVFVLTVIMIYSLEQMVSSERSNGARLAFILTYIATMLFSVCFGFAFYWNLLEARRQAVGDTTRILSAFNREVRVADQKLNNTVIILNALTAEFDERARLEFDQGSQCKGPSGSGEGPRTRHLNGRAASIRATVGTLTPQIENVQTASQTVLADIEEVIQIGLADADDTDTETRERVFRQATLSADDAAIQLEALATDPGITAQADQFTTWANQYADPNHFFYDETSRRQFQCPNLEIAASLRSVSNNLKDLPILQTPNLPTYAGATATREAVDRFFYTVKSFVPFVNAEQVRPETEREAAIERAAVSRALGEQAAEDTFIETSDQAISFVRSQKGIRADDAMPLILAFFIDGLLFLTSFWSRPSARFTAFGRLMREMREEKERPFEIVMGVKGLLENENYKALSPYLFNRANEEYLAVPTQTNTPEALQIAQIAMIWQASKILVPAPTLGSKGIAKRLKAAGSDVANDPRNTFRAMRFARDTFNYMMLKQIVDELTEQQKLTEQAEIIDAEFVEPAEDAVAGDQEAAVETEVEDATVEDPQDSDPIDEPEAAAEETSATDPEPTADELVDDVQPSEDEIAASDEVQANGVDADPDQPSQLNGDATSVEANGVDLDETSDSGGDPETTSDPNATETEEIKITRTDA